ncbi:ParB N-terminal domain-containing protein [Nocardia sp. NPDC050175]|uniref:ParB N-terminal domain-containing protein n=1 Tax=Nocardia sp. NPDC050175 TaxID=3364317 RepID=UPI003792838E
MVSVGSVRPGPALRDSVIRNDEYIRVLMESAAQLPPIIVHRPTMRLIDGAHRLEAAKTIDREMIAVRFFDGSDDDAYALAVHSNIMHGLPLSVAERKAAAMRLMNLYPQWSDRLIARTAGLSHTTVGAERRRATGGGVQLDRRVGKDGKVRPVVADDGRRIAANIIKESPESSLRAVSKRAGVSPSTVRDVRARLSRGEDPVVSGCVSSQAVDPRVVNGSSQSKSEGAYEPGMSPPKSAAAAQTPITTSVQDTILTALRSDPALRFTDKGRSILRLTGGSVVELRDWQQVMFDLPGYCHGSLARLARANAQSWIELANRLEKSAPGTGRRPKIVGDR